jgi:hypothetical protein
MKIQTLSGTVIVASVVTVLATAIAIVYALALLVR